MKKPVKDKVSDLIKAINAVRLNRFRFTIKVSMVEEATTFIEWDEYAGAFITKINSAPMDTYNIIITDRHKNVEYFRGNIDKNLYSHVNMLFNLSFFTGKSRL